MTRLRAASFLAAMMIITSHHTFADEEYGVDFSFPIHNMDKFRAKKENVHFQQAYDKLMSGCVAAFSQRECENSEESRLKMSREQPRSQHNYTDLGFKKTRVPEPVWKQIKAFWDSNKHKAKLEDFGRGYSIVNTWESPSYMVSFEDPKLRGGANLKQIIWDGLKPVIEQWTDRPIYETSIYGIRKYTTGAVLATHVDRLPLVSSAIINVDQDVDAPWPVEIYGRDGKAYNVTMEPGDMVLYESHTTLHGRPFPLQGKHFANIFVHFKPYDHDENNEKDRQAMAAEDRAIREQLEKRWTPTAPSPTSATRGQTKLHQAAAQGDVATAKKLIDAWKKDGHDLLHQKDENGWQALHEAARKGHTEIVKLLITNGADVKARTGIKGTGASALWWARDRLGSGHELIKYLESIGAPEIKSEEL